YRAGQDMSTDLGAFLDDADREFAAGRRGELLQTDRGGEAGRPAPDDDDVVLHLLALRVRHRPPLLCSFQPTIKDRGENGSAANSLLLELAARANIRCRT